MKETSGPSTSHGQEGIIHMGYFLWKKKNGSESGVTVQKVESRATKIHSQEAGLSPKQRIEDVLVCSNEISDT